MVKTTKQFTAVYFAFAFCIALGVLQTAHFYFYFEQGLATSVRWSVKGSLIWCVIFVVALNYVGRMEWGYFNERVKWLIWMLIILACGALQTFTAVFMDAVLGTASRPLIDDFVHLYNKRLLQNLLVAGLFFIGWHYLKVESRVEYASGRQQSTDQLEDKFPINDGQQIHRVSKADILYVEALGNYVAIHVRGATIVSRATLSSTFKSLDNNRFLRISRSAVVNIEHIKMFDRINKNRFEITLSDSSVVAVGRTYLKNVKARLTT